MRNGFNMRTNRWGFVLILMLIVTALAVLGRQRRTTAKLRSEILQQSAEASLRARLNADAQQLIAKQISREELERLRAERSAVAALRAEIETMKRRAEKIARAAAERPPTGTELNPIPPSMKDGAVSASLWKNVGEATPDAAFETALWAGVGGDVEKLASLLSFDAEAQTNAEAIFANLPASMQQELATPQRLIALLVAKDVPLGSARIWAQYGTPTDAKITAQLLDAEGKSKSVQLSLRSEADKWRFVVSGKIVERYAARLQAP